MPPFEVTLGIDGSSVTDQCFLESSRSPSVSKGILKPTNSPKTSSSHRKQVSFAESSIRRNDLPSVSCCYEPSFMQSTQITSNFLPLASLQAVLEDCQRRFGVNHSATGVAYNCLGNWYYRHKHWDLACQAYQCAIHPCRQRGSHTADALANLGTVYWAKGDLLQAQESFKKALATYIDQNPNPTQQIKLSVANVYHQLGLVYSLQGDTLKAMTSLQQAMWLRERYGTAAMAAETVEAMGQCCSLAGDYYTALTCFTQALNRCKSLSTLNHMAWVYCQLGDKRSSLNVYHDMLQQQQQIYAKACQANTPNRRETAVQMIKTLNNMVSLLDELNLNRDSRLFRDNITQVLEREGLALTDCV